MVSRFRAVGKKAPPGSSSSWCAFNTSQPPYNVIAHDRLEDCTAMDHDLDAVRFATHSSPAAAPIRRLQAAALATREVTRALIFACLRSPVSESNIVFVGAAVAPQRSVGDPRAAHAPYRGGRDRGRDFQFVIAHDRLVICTAIDIDSDIVRFAADNHPTVGLASLLQAAALATREVTSALRLARLRSPVPEKNIVAALIAAVAPQRCVGEPRAARVSSREGWKRCLCFIAHGRLVFWTGIDADSDIVRFAADNHPTVGLISLLQAAALATREVTSALGLA